jgi:hypothetical protein
MLLSDAIQSGMKMIKFDPWTFLKSPEPTGCLLGAAWLAKKGPAAHWRRTSIPNILKEWPWLNKKFIVPRPAISTKIIFPDKTSALNILTLWAFAIRDGKTTVEDAINWVREREREVGVGVGVGIGVNEVVS